MKKEINSRSTSRVVSILNCFTPEKLELSAYEISKITGIPMTTTYRILADLDKGRLLERNPNSGKYMIGIDLYFLGSLYLSTQDILKAADPVVKMLNDLTNETVFMSVFDKGNVVLTLKEESRHAFRFSHTIGTILPAYATAMGKAFLNELTVSEIDRLYPLEDLKPLTNNTIRTKAELRQELSRIGEKGVAFANEEGFEGIVAVADLIRGADGRAIAALSIDIPTFRSSQDFLNRLASLVKMGARLISFRLGYSDTENAVRDIEDLRTEWNKQLSDSTSQTKHEDTQEALKVEEYS
jgi:DNA-binding IclR family transcriptional regulator